MSECLVRGGARRGIDHTCVEQRRQGSERHGSASPRAHAKRRHPAPATARGRAPSPYSFALPHPRGTRPRARGLPAGRRSRGEIELWACGQDASRLVRF